MHISLTPELESRVKAKVETGFYNNASEVIRAGLRLLADDESRIVALKSAIEEGINSGIAEDFDPQAHLKSLKASMTNA